MNKIIDGVGLLLAVAAGIVFVIGTISILLFFGIILADIIYAALVTIF